MTDKESLQKENAAKGAKEYSDLPGAFETQPPEFAEGEEVYLIYNKWFGGWKSYAQESYEIHSNKPYAYFSHERPGEIDNSKLIDPQTNTLRKNLYDNVDFIVLNEATWKYLLDKYGGGPEIKRSVIRSSYGRTTVEVYPKEIWYVTAEQKEKKQLIISKSKTYKDLKVMLCGLLEIEPEKAISKMKIYGWYDGYDVDSGDVGSEILIEDNDKLDGYAIGDKSIIFVDPFGDFKKKSTRDISNTLNISSVYSSSSLFSSSYFPSSSQYSTSTAYTSTSSYSTDIASTPAIKGACGLENIGNTCYMNSGLQCLLNTVPLKEYFQSGKWKDDLNTTNPIGTGGLLAEAYDELINEVQEGRRGSVNPRQLKETVGKHCPHFSGFQQQDSHEFLTVMLDYLHEDLNRVKEKPYVEDKEQKATKKGKSKSESGSNDDEVDNEEQARIAWDNFLLRNKSVIVDLFYGQLKSTLKCPDCGNVSITFDPFSSLSVPLNTNVNTKGEIEEKREITVTVVKDPGNVQPYKMHVFGSDTLKDCAQMLIKAGILSPELRLFYITLDKKRGLFDKVFKDKTLIKDILSKHIYLYALAPPKEKGKKTFYIPVYTRLYEAKFFSADPNYVGMPYLMEAFVGDSALSLYANVFERFVTPFLRNGNDATKKVDVFLTKDIGGKPKLEVDLAHTKDKALPPPLDEKTYEAVIINVKTSSKREFEYVMKVDDLFPKNEPIDFKSIDEEKGEKEVTDDDDDDVSDVKEEKKGRKGHITLEECIKMFETPEKLDEDDMWYCPVCKDHKQALKTMSIWRLPKILIFHLKRFYCKKSIKGFCGFKNYNEKICTLVKSPLNDMSLYDFIDPESPFRKDDGNAKFNLFGVVNHMGTLNSGHYVAYAKGGEDGNWLCFNDAHVSAASADNVISDGNYVLFYQREIIN